MNIYFTYVRIYDTQHTFFVAAENLVEAAAKANATWPGGKWPGVAFKPEGFSTIGDTFLYSETVARKVHQESAWDVY